ncbi:DUF805 domain-containing protein [Polaribacter sp. IC063]|uniref:DUF805 domain-containing protein n=1 Tax=Polaribacter sp. IC063 TaxID=57031 RepID=UPI0011BDEA2C|nr:DUF805 domain-containing protein [Polaribacter sp. IC063]TXD50709.1 DUF805 domain-containing protein [Polaribacter sp. IC063]
MNWYLKVLKQYLDFSGRARRKEYWFFILFHIIFYAVCITLDVMLGTAAGEGDNEIGFLSLIYFLLTAIPSFALSIRRIHDIGKSGWMVLVSIIPIAGSIWFLVLTCMDSEAKANKWGENPKGIGNDNFINQIGTE